MVRLSAISQGHITSSEIWEFAGRFESRVNKNDEISGYPYTAEDIDCTIRQSNVNFFRRNHTKYFEHFTQMKVDIIMIKLNWQKGFLENTILVFIRNMFLNWINRALFSYIANKGNLWIFIL